MSPTKQTPPSLKNLPRTDPGEELEANKAYQTSRNQEVFTYYWLFYFWIKGLGVDPTKKGNTSVINHLLEDFKKKNGNPPNAPRTKGKARSEVFGDINKVPGVETYEDLIRKANAALKGELAQLEANIARDTKRMKELKAKLKQAGS